MHHKHVDCYHGCLASSGLMLPSFTAGPPPSSGCQAPAWHWPDVSRWAAPGREALRRIRPATRSRTHRSRRGRCRRLDAKPPRPLSERTRRLRVGQAQCDPLLTSSGGNADRAAPERIERLAPLIAPPCPPTPGRWPRSITVRNTAPRHEAGSARRCQQRRRLLHRSSCPGRSIP